MPVLRLFAAAREAAGTGHDTVEAGDVASVLAEAVNRYGERFAEVQPSCRIWVNGDPAESGDPVGTDDEIAVLPPVSGGAE